MATSYPFKPITTNGLVTYIDSTNGKSYSGGSYAHDIVGYSFGPLNNGVGYFNGSFQFDGVDDIIEFPDVYDVNGSSKLTISFWTKLNSTTGGLVNYWWDSNPNGGGIEIEIFSSIVYIAFYSNSYFYTNEVVPTGDWTNFNITYDGDNIESDRVKLYVNNTEYSLSVSGTIPSTIQDGEHLKIGRINDRYISGLIPTVMVYNRVLSTDEMFLNYGALKNRFI